tara:strand:+ start:384 stop:641 length:258 start_codon:yes stop_codon:yes gene_type:complete
MNDVLEKVKTWLKEEIEYNEPVLNGDEELSDGTEDIHEGRSECATSLLEQIKKWESEHTWESLAEQGHSPKMIESILAKQEEEDE